jgi:mRNA interferase RelE/StbE
MIAQIDRSFQKDLGKINDSKVKDAIAETIKNVEDANDLSSIKNLKKLVGHKDFYRIRIGDYRIGLRYTKFHELIFIRFLNRKEIYKKWP